MHPNAEATGSDKDLFDPHLTGVVDRSGATSRAASIEGRNHERIDNWLVGLVERAADQDAGLVRHDAPVALRHSPLALVSQVELRALSPLTMRGRGVGQPACRSQVGWPPSHVALPSIFSTGQGEPPD